MRGSATVALIFAWGVTVAALSYSHARASGVTGGAGPFGGGAVSSASTSGLLTIQTCSGTPMVRGHADDRPGVLEFSGLWAHDGDGPVNWLLVGAGFMAMTSILAFVAARSTEDPTDLDEDLDGPPGDS